MYKSAKTGIYKLLLHREAAWLTTVQTSKQNFGANDETDFLVMTLLVPQEPDVWQHVCCLGGRGIEGVENVNVCICCVLVGLWQVNLL